MKLEAWLTITNDNGVIEYHKQANSLVLSFLDFLAIQCGQQTLTLTKIISGTNNTAPNSLNMSLLGPVNTSTYGVRVGTGSTAVALTDTDLVTAITHGSGAGNLSHGATSVSAPVTVGTTRQFTVSRTFTNNSGSDITVNEVGLVGLGAGATIHILIDRTLNTFSIANGASKTVTYTIKVTV